MHSEIIFNTLFCWFSKLLNVMFFTFARLICVVLASEVHIYGVEVLDSVTDGVCFYSDEMPEILYCI